MDMQAKRESSADGDLNAVEQGFSARRAWARERVEGARRARRRVVWALGAMGAAGALVYVFAIASVAGAA